MAGEWHTVRQRNGSLVVAGYGTKLVYVTQLGHGVTVIAEQDEAATRAAFYPHHRSSGSFTIVLACPSAAEYDQLGSWLKVYAQRLAAGALGPMRVLVPSRGFDKTAIPLTGIGFGAEAGRLVHTMALSFMGTSEPLEASSGVMAKYELPYGDRYNVSRFHPAGVQAGGPAGKSPYDLPYEDTGNILNQAGGIAGRAR